MQQTNINEEINKLVKLQELDSQLYGLNKEKEEKPKILEELNSEFEQKKQILKEFQDRSKALTLKRKDKEGELTAKEESINQLKSKLYSLKTNKEMDAMLSEINGLGADKSLLEEAILKIFDEQDSLKQELEKKQEQIKGEEGKFNQAKQAILDRIKEIDTQISGLESKRTVAEKEIDQKLLSQYNRILKGKKDLALVKVNGCACQGCFINVTQQVINEIKRSDKLIFCEMCARILYISDE